MAVPDKRYLDYLDVFKGKDEQWYFKGKSNNGEVLFTSEGYTDKSDAFSAAEDIAQGSIDSIQVQLHE